MSTKKSVRFYAREDGILVFEFSAMDRQAADEFAKFVRAGANNVPEKLRVLYDFTQSLPPTRYFLKFQSQLYNTFPHPQDEKSAYVTGVWNNEVWIRIIRSYLVSQDTTKIFKSKDEALIWLLE